eukprot:COSAG01_NODE_6208_length_3794_cov_2.218133_5_plen_449_part_01
MVVKPEYPWEAGLYFYNSVVQVSAERFHLYYGCAGPANESDSSSSGTVHCCVDCGCAGCCGTAVTGSDMTMTGRDRDSGNSLDIAGTLAPPSSPSMAALAPPSYPSSFDAMVQAFDMRVRELKGVMGLRTPAPDDDLAECLSRLAKSLCAVEKGFQALQGAVEAEKQSLPHAEAVAAKVSEQTELLRQVFANLPQQLPGAASVTDAASPSTQSPAAAGSRSTALRALTNGSPGGAGGAAATTTKGKKKRQQQGVGGGAGPSSFSSSSPRPPQSARRPRRPTLEYVTKDQLDAAPAYTKGRLTIDKVNAGVDELRELLRAKYEICAADRRKSKAAGGDSRGGSTTTLSRGDSKRVALWRTQARAPETQGYPAFFSEDDLTDPPRGDALPALVRCQACSTSALSLSAADTPFTPPPQLHPHPSAVRGAAAGDRARACPRCGRLVRAARGC